MSKLSAQDVLRRYAKDYSVELTDVNQRETPAGDAPLHTACIRGKIDEVQALVEGGADVNMQGEEGYTPLHYAVDGGHGDIVRLLLHNGASTSTRSTFGRTPRELAEANGFDHIVRLFDGLSSH